MNNNGENREAETSSSSQIIIDNNESTSYMNKKAPIPKPRKKLNEKNKQPTIQQNQFLIQNEPSSIEKNSIKIEQKNPSSESTIAERIRLLKLQNGGRPLNPIMMMKPPPPDIKPRKLSIEKINPTISQIITTTTTTINDSTTKKGIQNAKILMNEFRKSFKFKNSPSKIVVVEKQIEKEKIQEEKEDLPGKINKTLNENINNNNCDEKLETDEIFTHL